MNHFNYPLHNTRLAIAPCSRSATTRSATANNTFLNFVHACKNFVSSRRVVSEASCRLHGWLALSIVCATAFSFVPSASADINGVVTAWGNNGWGQCTIPASASSGVSHIAGGTFHTIALKNLTSTCSADLNQSGFVDSSDLGTLLGQFGPCPSECASDFNKDGVVDSSDLGTMLGQFGGCP